jgi:hypothetical protein
VKWSVTQPFSLGSEIVLEKKLLRDPIEAIATFLNEASADATVTDSGLKFSRNAYKSGKARWSLPAFAEGDIAISEVSNLTSVRWRLHSKKQVLGLLICMLIGTPVVALL